MRQFGLSVACLLSLFAIPAQPQFSNQYQRHRPYSSYRRQQQQGPRVQLHDAFTSGRETPWSVLGIDKSASEKDVKAAYRRLALENHPDKGGSEEKFILAKAAFDTLTERELVDEYRLQNAQSDWKRSDHASASPPADGWGIVQRWAPWLVGAATILGMAAFWGDKSGLPESNPPNSSTAPPDGGSTSSSQPPSWLTSIRNAARRQAVSAVELGELKLPVPGAPASAVKRGIVMLLPRTLAESGAAWSAVQSCAKILQPDGVRLAWALAADSAEALESVSEHCPGIANKDAVTLVYLRRKSAGLFVASTTLNGEVFDGLWPPGAEAKAWCERVCEGLTEMSKVA
jgi:hypothetical protein